MRHLNPLTPEIKYPPHDGAADGVGPELAPGLDPVRHRIIAAHWFGWRPVSGAGAGVVIDLRSRRQAKRQHARGFG